MIRIREAGILQALSNEIPASAYGPGPLPRTAPLPKGGEEEGFYENLSHQAIIADYPHLTRQSNAFLKKLTQGVDILLLLLHTTDLRIV